MDDIKQLPNKEIKDSGCVGKKFLELGVDDFHHACRWVRDLPYGYNSNHSDPLIVFAERRGIFTTKHGVKVARSDWVGSVWVIIGFPWISINIALIVSFNKCDSSQYCELSHVIIE